MQSELWKTILMVETIQGVSENSCMKFCENYKSFRSMEYSVKILTCVAIGNCDGSAWITRSKKCTHVAIG